MSNQLVITKNHPILNFPIASIPTIKFIQAEDFKIQPSNLPSPYHVFENKMVWIKDIDLSTGVICYIECYRSN